MNYQTKRTSRRPLVEIPKDVFVCANCETLIKPFLKPKFTEKFGTVLIIGTVIFAALGFVVWLPILLFAVFLFALFLIVALADLVTSRKKVCPVCESESILPQTSPVAQKIIGKI